jgi:hypothetical protein
VEYVVVLPSLLGWTVVSVVLLVPGTGTSTGAGVVVVLVVEPSGLMMVFVVAFWANPTDAVARPIAIASAETRLVRPIAKRIMRTSCLLLLANPAANAVDTQETIPAADRFRGNGHC